MKQYTVQISISAKDKSTFKRLKFDGDEVIMKELSDDKKEEFILFLDRMADQGIINSIVKSWGYQEEGYLITEVGKQLLKQLQ